VGLYVLEGLVFSDTSLVYIRAGVRYSRRDSGRNMEIKRRTGYRLVPLAIVMASALSVQAYGQGDLEFEPHVQYLTGGQNSTGVAAADIDGDGDIDLLFSNRWTDDVTTLMNDGEGVFHFAGSVGVGIMPRYVRAADFDGDDSPDCATPDYDGSTVSIVLNDGSGTLLLHQFVELYRPAVLDIVDVDGDTDNDILVAHWDENSSQPSQAMAMVTILFNDGTGTFATGDPATIGIQPRGMDIADFNHDGFPDVIVCNLASSDMDLLINAGDGTFLPTIVLTAPHQPRFVTAGDWNDDGAVDLAVVSKSTAIVEFQRNDGSLGFKTTQSLATMSNPHSCTNADLDLDGDLDVLVSHVGSSNVSIYLNDGQGTFAPRWNLYSPNGPAEVITADLDADGVPDIVTANTNNHTCSVHINAQEYDAPPCRSDLDGNEAVDVLDLLIVIQNWMSCSGGSCPPGDINASGQIDILDLLYLLEDWGDCLE